ncbi:unnamed protein product [Clonostachys rosea f. rosea IK726]|uniref:Uncharacterized protein n=2 Tax=Bionectria ochroleuca TaxID=29856 RepID=A0A0B7KGW6_BIOOC|nr:unnamed protein product [Clonostachys rosea f. rosea IK726]
MGLFPIPSRLGVFRLSNLDASQHELEFEFEDKYIFAVAQKYPKDLNEALVVIYFATPPYKSSEATIFTRTEDGTGFRRHAKIKTIGNPCFEVRARYFPRDEPKFCFDSPRALLYAHRGGARTVRIVDMGINIAERLEDPLFHSAWDETAGQRIRYKAIEGTVWDDTNSRKVISINHLLKWPLNAKFGFELLSDSSLFRKGPCLIPAEHVLSVVAMATVHTLLVTSYWWDGLRSSPLVPEEIRHED